MIENNTVFIFLNLLDFEKITLIVLFCQNQKRISLVRVLMFVSAFPVAACKNVFLSTN